MACCCPGLIGAWFVGKSVKHQLNNEFGNDAPLDPKWDPRNDEEYAKVRNSSESGWAGVAVVLMLLSLWCYQLDMWPASCT